MKRSTNLRMILGWQLRLLPTPTSSGFGGFNGAAGKMFLEARRFVLCVSIPANWLVDSMTDVEKRRCEKPPSTGVTSEARVAMGYKVKQKGGTEEREGDKQSTLRVGARFEQRGWSKCDSKIRQKVAAYQKPGTR